MSLAKYNKKRSFAKTSEPRGKKTASKKSGPLRFVVQKHDASHLHYDFRLEIDGVLKSWAVPKGPSMNPKDKRLAMMTEDHPLSYASFEGTIPKGEYGAGDVIVWDTGVYTSAETADQKESQRKIRDGLDKGDLKFVLLGEKLKGAFALVRLETGEPNAWLLIKKHDEYATDSDVTAHVSSVLSGTALPRDRKKETNTRPVVRPKKKTKSKSKRPAMPHGIKPMLAKLTDGPFDREGWVFEIKWDGYRAIAEIENGEVSLYSRNGNPFNRSYPVIVDALRNIPHDCILDGEIIAIENGKTSFQALQYYKETPVPLQYAVFDLLYIDGEDLRGEPLRERKKRLEAILPKDDAVLLYSEHISEKGTPFFESIQKEGLEGIIAKNELSPYREGTRSEEWFKVKSYDEQEAIIVGFTEPRGSRKLIGSLVLAIHEGKQLKYIGHSGGGFTDRELKDLHDTLQKIATKKSPLKEEVPVNSPITWVKPKYVCEVTFREWTKDGRMRHPIYKGLRSDKPPSSITREEVISEPSISVAKAVDELRFTHTDKIYWPDEGYTKGDLIAYYDEIADMLLPYLKDRPQNLNRHPHGIKGDSFYQKNIEQEVPSFVTTKDIWSESNNDFIRYVVCQNRETLLFLVNLGCIELNPWNSRIDSLEYPDYMILDLDPNGRDFDDLMIVAREVKAVLTTACEKNFFLKTSGKSGLHIVIPLDAKYPYDDVRAFAELIMQIVHKEVPDITSIERSPSKRKGMIYLDYLQNRFGQTLACAYSVRPYPGATVSTPIDWSELRKGFSPARFTIKTMKRRLREKGDIWKPVIGPGVDLAASLRSLQEELKKL